MSVHLHFLSVGDICLTCTRFHIYTYLQTHNPSQNTCTVTDTHAHTTTLGYIFFHLLTLWPTYAWAYICKFTCITMLCSLCTHICGLSCIAPMVKGVTHTRRNTPQDLTRQWIVAHTMMHNTFLCSAVVVFGSWLVINSYAKYLIHPILLFGYLCLLHCCCVLFAGAIPYANAHISSILWLKMP